MNRLADAPEYAASVKKMAQTIFCRKSFAAISVSLEEFYQTEKLFDAALLKNDVTRSQFNGTISTFTPLVRNIPTPHFVYTGAAAYRAVAARSKKNPAVAAAGL